MKDWRPPIAADDVDVDYYRCYTCANVWMMPKDKPESPSGVTLNVKAET